MKKKIWIISLFIFIFFFLNINLLFSQDNSDLLNLRGYLSVYNFNFGAKSAGTANSFVAVADDLTSVYCNPAGLIKNENISIFVSYTERKIDYNYSGLETQIGDVSHIMSSKQRAIDFFSVALPVNFFSLDFSFAVSYFRLFPYRIIGNESTFIKKKSKNYFFKSLCEGKKGIDVLALSTSFSWNEVLSLGFSILNYCGQGERSFSFYQENELLALSVNKEKLRGVNFVFGALLYVNDYLNLGLSYKTKLNNKLKYNYSLKEVGKDSLIYKDEINCILPSTFSLGFNITPLWSIDLSYELSIVHYSGKNIDKNSFLHTLLISNNTNENCIFHRMGLQLKLPINPNFHSRVSLGYAIEENIFPVDRMRIIDYTKVKIKKKTFGVGVTILGDFDIDLAFIHSRGAWKEELLNYNLLLESEIKEHCVVLSFGYSFSNSDDFDF